MEKYTKVPKQKEETEIEEKEIRVTTQGKPRNFISYATSLFKEKGATEVVLKAMGRAISKTVTIAEIIKRRIPGLHQITVIDSTDITDIWEPKEEGLDRLETTRHVSSITITLSTQPLDTSAPGYQAPIPAEQVKDFSFGTARKGTRRQFVPGGGQQFGNVRRDNNFQSNYGGNFQKNFGGRPAMNRGGGGPRQIGGGGRRGFDRGLRDDFQSDNRPFRGGRRGMSGPGQGQMGGRRFNTQGGQAQGGQFQGQGQYQGGQFQGQGQMFRQGPRRGNFNNQGLEHVSRGRMQGGGGPRRQFHQGGQFQGQGGQFQGQGGQFQGQGGHIQAQGSSNQGGFRGRRNFNFQGRFAGGPQVGRRRFAGRGQRRLPEAEEVLDGDDIEEQVDAGEDGEEYGEEDD